jgi:hypothetical protein
MALKEAIKEALYLSNIITYINKELNLGLNILITPIMVDSKSAKSLAENPEFHKRSKHIDIQYHFIREVIRNNKATLYYINTKLQLADSFTKGLSIKDYTN